MGYGPSDVGKLGILQDRIDLIREEVRGFVGVCIGTPVLRRGSALCCSDGKTLLAEEDEPSSRGSSPRRVGRSRPRFRASCRTRMREPRG